MEFTNLESLCSFDLGSEMGLSFLMYQYMRARGIGEIRGHSLDGVVLITF